MKGLIIAILLVCALAAPPPNKLGNPDEWGTDFQGDIKFAPGRSPKNGLIDESFRWPNGNVLYMFDSKFNESKKETVLMAMDSYDTLTDGCITFTMTMDMSLNHLHILGNDSDGCWSYVGMQGGGQGLNYPDWCIDQYGSVQHELYHALGFYHEQSRTDRDDYVTIMSDNIKDGAEGNFELYSESQVKTFGYGYDYGSIMHYSSYAFSKNGEMTIVTKNETDQEIIGQRVGLSETDIGKLMAMYNC